MTIPTVKFGESLRKIVEAATGQTVDPTLGAAFARRLGIPVVKREKPDVTVKPNRGDKRRAMRCRDWHRSERFEPATSPRALHVAPLTIRPRSSNPAARKLAKRLIRRARRITDQENAK